MYIDSFELLRNITFFFATLMLLKYYAFLLLAPLYPIKERFRKMRITKQQNYSPQVYEPLVSVVIPAWNEEVGIIRTITSLLDNTYKNIEIVVVNDGSTDATGTVVKSFIARNETYKDTERAKVKYLYQENSGKGHALNYGIQQSRGEIIVTMDADTVFENHALEYLVNDYFADPTLDAVVGNVKVSENETILGLLQKLEYTFGFYFKRAHAVMGAEYIFGGACAAFRRDTTFDRFGLFDTTNKTEDIEMSMRLRAYGAKCTYAEDVICYTEGADSLLGLVNQRLRWKKGRFDTFIKYRSLFFSTSKNHNKFLTWFILPYSLFGEAQLLFEPIAISLLLGYSFISGDYFSLLFGSLFMFTIYFVNTFFSKGLKPIDRLTLIPMFFFTWGLFYILVWIEYMALLKSLLMVLRGNDVVWQNWQRKGVQAEL